MKEDVEKLGEGLPLPHTTDFVDNGPGKNATKIEVDMKKNEPFIREFKARLDAVGDPEAQKKIMDEFHKATGIPFEKAFEAMENKCTVIINKEDGSVEVKRVDKDSEEAKTGKIVNDEEHKPHLEDPEPRSTAARPKKIDTETSAAEGLQKAANESEAHEVEEEEDPELVAEIIANLEDAKANPENLKFTTDEIAGLIKLEVVGDEATVRALADNFNQEVDKLIKEKNDPNSQYSDPKVYDKAIRDNLAVKISLKQSLKAAEEVTDPAFIQEIFAARYPDYTKRGPASILDLYTGYLEQRISKPENKDFFFKELTDKHKVAHILKRANDEIFSQMQTRDGRKFNTAVFINIMFDINKRYIAEILETPNDEKFTLKSAESIMTVFLIPFVRLIYKKLAPDFKTRKMERKYIVGFIMDMANPEQLSEDKRAELDKSAKTMWAKLREIEIELIEYEKTHFDKNGVRIKK